MLNRDGVIKTSYVSANQILMNPNLFQGVGCVVAQAVGVSVGTKTIAKAGTPIHLDFANRETEAVLGDGGTAMNAVLLHDVDVTAGPANGTAVIFGFINLNRVDSDVQGKITTATSKADASKLITFIKA